MKQIMWRILFFCLLPLLGFSWSVSPALLSLNGTYEVFTNRLLSPKEVKQASPDGFLKFPAKWDKIKDASGKKLRLPWRTVVTFHLQVHTPYAKGEPCGLLVYQLGTSYRFYLNGRLLITNGIPALHKSAYHAEIRPNVVFFDSPSRDWDIVIQSANYVDRMGNLCKSVQTGVASEIIRVKFLRIASLWFVVGVLVIMMLYHLILFLANRHDFSNFWYAMLILVASLRSLLEGEKFFIYVFSGFNFNITMRLVYLSYYLGLFVFLSFMRNVFTGKFPVKIVRLLQILIFIFNLGVFVLPLPLLTSTQVFFHGLSLIVLALIVTALVRAVLVRLDFAVYYLVGVLFLFGTGLNDILYSLGVWQTGYFLHWGVFLFILVQTIALSARFSKIESLPDETKGNLTQALSKVSLKFGDEVGLSKREKEVIVELSSGKSYREIADVLFISVRTVKYHVYHIYQKSEVGTRAELFNRMMVYEREL